MSFDLIPNPRRPLGARHRARFVPLLLAGLVLLCLELLCVVSPGAASTVTSRAASSVDDQAKADAPPAVEARIDELLKRMTLEEKVGQMTLRGRSSSATDDASELASEVRAGRIGLMLNIMEPEVADRLQAVAVEESRLGIPLLFGRDVIHGFRTVFPIPLGQAASFDPETVEAAARASAVEAATYGIRWTFAPMADITRDPRWGRIAESPGEDPYLAEAMTKAMVRGYQGDDLARPHSLAACVKHFAAYGAAVGGRDYAGAHVPRALLHNVYLRPFRAAVDAGAATLMTGFHELDGVPATADPYLLRDVLREDWGFQGFVVSDWNSVTEMIAHGVAEDEAAAARLAARAGVDVEMTSRAFQDHLPELVRRGQVDEATLDAAVRHVLRVKFWLGLFDESGRYAPDEDPILSPSHLELAREAARRSVVLLKNEVPGRSDGDTPTGPAVLPLAPDATVAVIGPLADAPHEQLGTWTFDGQAEDSHTPLQALRQRLGDDGLGDDDPGESRVRFAAGLPYSRSRDRSGFSAARAAAEASDVVVFFGGEEAILSGEAHSRADLRLPGLQEELILELAETGKPLVLVLMSGRPNTLEAVVDAADAVLAAWHPGTMAGPALADLLLGDVSPSGRLPVSWPRSVGQIPVYYNHKNTGRPAPGEVVTFDDIPVGAWQSSLSNTSRYLDLEQGPLYPFGHGLTYGAFTYSDLEVATPQVAADGTVVVSAKLTNDGPRRATEVPQLYVRDLVASLSRPVRELKGFQRLELGPGESTTVTFELPAKDLVFFGPDGVPRLEPGEFHIWIAPDAASGVHGSFRLVAPQEASAARDAVPAVPWLERHDPDFDALVEGAEIEVLGTGFTWSEGPVWVGGPAEDGGFLLFSDVPENTVHRWTAEGGVEPWIRPSGLLLGGPRSREPGANGLAVDADGRLLLCQHGDRRVARLTVPPSEGPWLEEAAPVETLADAWEGRRFHSPNDLVIHPNGDVYFTDPPYGLAGGPESELREMEHHGVYRIRSADSAESAGEPKVELLHDGLSRPNGIALSPDGGTLYVANSDPENALWMSWRVTDEGLEDGRVFFDATDQVSEDRPGLPDGMAVDREGRLFATGPGGVWVFSPRGTHLGTLRLDGPTANCTFGDDGRSLFVTRDDRLLRIRLHTVGLGFEIPGAPRLRNSIKEAQYSVSPRGGTASLSSMRRRRSSRCASQ